MAVAGHGHAWVKWPRRAFDGGNKAVDEIALKGGGGSSACRISRTRLLAELLGDIGAVSTRLQSQGMQPGPVGTSRNGPRAAWSRVDDLPQMYAKNGARAGGRLGNLLGGLRR